MLKMGIRCYFLIFLMFDKSTRIYKLETQNCKSMNFKQNESSMTIYKN